MTTDGAGFRRGARQQKFAAAYPCRITVSSPPSHGGNPGSNPGGGTQTLWLRTPGLIPFGSNDFRRRMSSLSSTFRTVSCSGWTRAGTSVAAGRKKNFNAVDYDTCYHIDIAARRLLRRRVRLDREDDPKTGRRRYVCPSGYDS